MALRTQLKQWFKTAAKPTQEQFAAAWDTFFSKEEDTLPISKVEGLADALANKADADQAGNGGGTIAYLPVNAQSFGLSTDGQGRLTYQNNLLKGKVGYLIEAPQLAQKFSMTQNKDISYNANAGSFTILQPGFALAAGQYLIIWLNKESENGDTGNGGGDVDLSGVQSQIDSLDERVDALEDGSITEENYTTADKAAVATIANKVDKVTGKGLSANDYTDADKASVGTIANKVDQVAGKGLSTNDYTNADKASVGTIANKVDAVAGKGLSTNDYTDADKASVGTIANKVDTVAGKGLSTNDYTNADKASVGTIANKVDQVAGKGLSTNDYTNADKASVGTIANKVDQVAGKGLSTNDYTDADKAKLGGIAAGATANATDAQLRDRSTHTGTQSADTITDGATNKAYTAVEKTKLAGVATGATANATDAQLRDRSTHTGTQSADSITDGATNKAYTAAEKTKLAGVATGATANATDAQLRDRSTHTGTQLAATISDFTNAAQTAVGTVATDAEVQITAAVAEDNKLISRLKLFNWWTWVKTQTLTWAANIVIKNILANPSLSLVDSSNNAFVITRSSGGNAVNVSNQNVSSTGLGGALKFSGGSIAVTASTALNGNGQPWSWGLWIQQSGPSFGDNSLFGWGAVDIVLGQALVVRNGSNLINTGNVFTEVNTWTRVFVTYNGSNTVKVYKNGSLYQSYTVTVPNTTSTLNSFGMLTVQNGTSGNNITVDQLLFYNRELTSGEVSTDYNGGSGVSNPNATNLVLHLGWDEGSGTTTADYQGLSAARTLSGAYTWVAAGKVPKPTGTAATTQTVVSIADGFTQGDALIMKLSAALAQTFIRGQFVGFEVAGKYPLAAGGNGFFRLDPAYTDARNTNKNVQETALLQFAGGNSAYGAFQFTAQAADVTPSASTIGVVYFKGGRPYLVDTSASAKALAYTTDTVLQANQFKGGSGTPAIAANTGAGTSPTVTISGNDVAGAINLTQGSSSPLSGVVVRVTFSNAYATAPRVSLTPRSQRAALDVGKYYVSAETTTYFEISAATNLTDAGIYTLNYQVIA